MKKWIGLILGLAFSFGFFYLLNSYSYSSGVRSGRLVKLTKKGALIKTYEGTLDLGSGNNLTWDFSVRNDDVGDKMIQNMGQLMELHYHERLFQWYYDTQYDVYNWKLDSHEYSQNQGASGAHLCLFIKELSRENQLVIGIKSFLESRQSVFLEDFEKCLKP